MVCIACDLGTAYTVIGILLNGKVEIIANNQGNRITPSIVAFNSGEILIGEGAKNQEVRNPENTIYDVKRLIGRKYTDAVVENDIQNLAYKVVANSNNDPLITVKYKNEIKYYTPEEISSFIISEMKNIIEKYLGETVNDIVITVPAYFNNSQRQSTKNACQIAGLNVLRILNEPTAAAIAYGFDNKSEKEKNILIFDIGAGTFDITILNVVEGIFEVLATGGCSHLGGNDYDNILIDHMISIFEKKHKLDIRNNPKALKKLKSGCETAKRSLSTSAQAPVEIDTLYEGIDFYANLTRAKFDELVGHLNGKCMEIVNNVLVDAEKNKNDIDEIILVGGSSRIVKLQQMLSEMFNNKKLCKTLNPDECVAYGAAVQAAYLSNNETNDILLLDVCPLSLGIETKNGVMSTIIPRNTTIPIKKTQMFSTESDLQSFVTIQLYEGERQFVKDNNLLGTFTLNDLPLLPKGELQIEISINIDVNNIVQVIAQEKNTNKISDITITNNKSKNYIDQMLINAKNYSDNDKNLRAILNTRINLENYLDNVLENIINNSSVKMDKTDKDEIKKIIDSSISWLNNDFIKTQENYDNKEKEIKEIIKNILHP